MTWGIGLALDFGYAACIRVLAYREWRSGMHTHWHRINLDTL